jgi:hypothetical protein
MSISKPGYEDHSHLAMLEREQQGIDILIQDEECIGAGIGCDQYSLYASVVHGLHFWHVDINAHTHTHTHKGGRAQTDTYSLHTRAQISNSPARSASLPALPTVKENWAVTLTPSKD